VGRVCPRHGHCGRPLNWVVSVHVANDRDAMTKALRAVAVPKIRALGFSGNFPHFRRKRGNENQMLMFGFNKYGGSFYLEAGSLSDAELEEKSKRWSSRGKPLTEAALEVGHCKWDRRARLGGEKIDPNSDHWFVYGPQKGEITLRFRSASHFELIAAQVERAIDVQVEAFFERAR
jgi:hypothetical protein